MDALEAGDFINNNLISCLCFIKLMSFQQNKIVTAFFHQIFDEALLAAMLSKILHLSPILPKKRKNKT